MSKPIVGFCGMSHLGISSALASISRDFETICYDKDPKTVKKLKKNTLDIDEPFFNEILIKKNNFINFTNEIEILKKCDLVYISLDIKTNNVGESNLTDVKQMIEDVISVLEKNQILIILSQVAPGFTKFYSKKFKNIFYQVETLIFGKAYERAMYPERYIIGCLNPHKELPKKFKCFLKQYNCPILKMNFESAELTKISINMCLISSITIANKMAEICENIGADWNEIIPALRLDKRIGFDSYIQAGLGLSGGNLERDIATTIKISRDNKINTDLFNTFFDISKQRKEWVYKILKNIVFPQINNPKIAILGLSYKANTNSIKNAPSVRLLNKLKENKVIAYDPVIDVKQIATWCQKANTIKDATNQADILIILTPWSEILNINLEMIVKNMNEKFFIDPFNYFNKKEVNKMGFKYFSLGSKTKERLFLNEN